MERTDFMGLPTISVEFKALATSAIVRSARGILAVVIQDSTASWNSLICATVDDLKENEFTAENYAILKRAFDASPYRLVVVRVASGAAITAATAILDKAAYNWVCSPVGDYQAGLVEYVKKVNGAKRVRPAKALVTGISKADNMHVVNVANTAVQLNGKADDTPMLEYLPYLAGVLATCPMDRSVTYKAMTDLERVTEVEKLDDTIDGGNLVLFLDDDTVRIARGVNTLTTLEGTSYTPGMMKIAVVEAMDMIQEDIIRTFKTYYLGKKKNTADNQALFVSDVLTYLHSLADEDILERTGTISAAIDVAAMRKAWLQDDSSTASLTDEQIKCKPYRSYVFLTAQAQILDAMEDMKLRFSMS